MSPCLRVRPRIQGILPFQAPCSLLSASEGPPVRDLAHIRYPSAEPIFAPMNMSRKIRVTKRFTFEMAHALRCHDGLCAHIHGHSYVLDVTLEGMPAQSHGDPKDGMVIDFADLKKIVKSLVVDVYDHALVLHERERSTINSEEPLFGRTIFTQWQPTCENMLLHIVELLAPAMPEQSPLVAARLQETASSWAEWEA